MLILSLLILGFVLMSGGGSSDPNVFTPEIFSFRRITLAPLIIIGSYSALIWLIFKKSVNWFSVEKIELLATANWCSK